MVESSSGDPLGTVRHTATHCNTGTSSPTLHQDHASHSRMGVLRTLPLSVRQHIAALLKTRRFEPGELLSTQSVSPEVLWIVLDGRCSVEAGALFDGECRGKGV